MDSRASFVVEIVGELRESSDVLIDRVAQALSLDPAKATVLVARMPGVITKALPETRAAKVALRLQSVGIDAIHRPFHAAAEAVPGASEVPGPETAPPPPPPAPTEPTSIGAEPAGDAAAAATEPHPLADVPSVDATLVDEPPSEPDPKLTPMTEAQFGAADIVVPTEPTPGAPAKRGSPFSAPIVEGGTTSAPDREVDDTEVRVGRALEEVELDGSARDAGAAAEPGPSAGAAPEPVAGAGAAAGPAPDLPAFDEAVASRSTGPTPASDIELEFEAEAEAEAEQPSGRPPAAEPEPAEDRVPPPPPRYVRSERPPGPTPVRGTPVPDGARAPSARARDAIARDRATESGAPPPARGQRPPTLTDADLRLTPPPDVAYRSTRSSADAALKLTPPPDEALRQSGVGAEALAVTRARRRGSFGRSLSALLALPLALAWVMTSVFLYLLLPSASRGELWLPLVVSAGIAALVGMLVGMLLTNGVGSDVAKLRSDADRIAMGDLSTPVRARRDDELGDVAASIDRMRLSLQESLERLRRRRG
jgi:HAMP domain-containing protein